VIIGAIAAGMQIVQKIWTIRIEKLDEKGTREISGLGLWADGSLAILFPNDAVETLQAAKGETIKIPDPQNHQLAHIRLAVSTLPDEPEITEQIKVVATKTNDLFTGGISEQKMQEVQLSPGVNVQVITDPDIAREEYFRWFFSIPPDEIAIAQTQYHVVEK